MCTFATFGFSLPVPGFSLGLPRVPDVGFDVDIGIDMKLRTFPIPGLPIPGFSLGLPRAPDVGFDVDLGIELKLRSFGFALPIPGFSLGLPRFPDVAPPPCPLET